MSTLSVGNPPSIVASIVGEALPFPFPDIPPETDFYIDFPDFGCVLATLITAFRCERDLDAVTLRANVDNDAIIDLTSSGRLSHVKRPSCMQAFWENS